MKRPDFESFRELFLSCLAGCTGKDSSVWAERDWSEVGDIEDRRNVLETVNEKLRQSHGLEFEVNDRLLSVQGPVESAVIQTFHELSTIHLMERINAKIKGKMN